MQTDGDKQAEEQIQQTRLKPQEKKKEKKMETWDFKTPQDSAKGAETKLTTRVFNSLKNRPRSLLWSDWLWRLCLKLMQPDWLAVWIIDNTLYTDINETSIV